MKGILLAGGSGSRLYPTTQAVSKQLIPVYDKPTIYYPLTTLMLAGVREILVISTPRDIPRMREMLKDGKQYGLNIEYIVQDRPRGIAEAMILGEKFVGNDVSTLILGDNLFYGHDLGTRLERALKAAETRGRATVFAHQVSDPERYGVVTLDEGGRPLALVEKPKAYVSPWAVTGLYVYPAGVSLIAGGLEPSRRGELEITDLNNFYLNKSNLDVELLGRGYAWLDTGTPQSLLEASQFVATLENRQGQKIGCPEEIALQSGFINAEEFSKLLESIPACAYHDYLKEVLEDYRAGTRHRS